MSNVTYGKLTLQLASPLLIPTEQPFHGIKLDGILGILWARDNGLNKTPLENLPEQIQFPELPLVKIAPQVYGASTMFLPKPGDSRVMSGYFIHTFPETINRSANWNFFFGRLVRDNVVKDFLYEPRSQYRRANQKKYWCLATPVVDFYFATEDYPALTEYFERIRTEIPGIGAKCHIGYGAIDGVYYKTIDEDKCFYYQKDGYPTRPIPVDGPFKGKFPDSCISICSYKPPYFSMHTRTLCYTPRPSQYLPLNVIGGETPDTAFEDALDKQSGMLQRIFDKWQAVEAAKAAKKAAKKGAKKHAS